MLSIFAWQGLFAQAVSTGSRLNMTVKKKTENVNFRGIPSGLHLKPLSLQNSNVVTNFFRSFLLSSFSTQEAPKPAVNETIARNIDKGVAPIEHSNRKEEQLYTSDKITVSNIYPNPASEYAELDYSISTGVREAKLIIYNVLGSQMQELPLNKAERKLRVNTSEMPTGLYFYQLSLEGQKVATKKMLVRHQQ